ncbi:MULTISPECIES: fimbrial protein [Providencia]|uniref:fimbrial protein n=1 Tax=Providencia TaxID=586 RepID=UPI001CFC84AB|nr:MULTISPECIES: fimbrial protein [Providencia]EIU7559092.1 fimbrial protein [Providencia rettgeri]MCB4843030.1 fimbrial protein [Providencia rettgeri]MCG5276064.1 fimbrial protein [Providencia rettgeri]MCG9509217.1 fimbrial protein [Providencia rettgeri]
MRTKIRRQLLLLGMLSALSFSSLAAFTVNFNGTLVVTPPECTFNGGSTADVQFGDVHETLIDNSSYKRTPIVYALNCTQVYSNALKMTLVWNAITLNGQNVVRTNRTNLGVAIYQNNTRLNSGTVLNFTYGGTMPALYAVPVKPAGTTLTNGGAFNGVLTMVVDYR